jgi:hypothetical protein
MIKEIFLYIKYIIVYSCIFIMLLVPTYTINNIKSKNKVIINSFVYREKCMNNCLEQSIVNNNISGDDVKFCKRLCEFGEII